jgi:hypothetical protein
LCVVTVLVLESVDSHRLWRGGWIQVTGCRNP